MWTACALSMNIVTALLRSGNIHEDLTMACQVQDILDREVFGAFHYTVEGFTAAVTGRLGVNLAWEFSHNQPRGGENGEGVEQRESSSRRKNESWRCGQSTRRC